MSHEDHHDDDFSHLPTVDGSSGDKRRDELRALWKQHSRLPGETDTLPAEEHGRHATESTADEPAHHEQHEQAPYHETHETSPEEPRHEWHEEESTPEHTPEHFEQYSYDLEEESLAGHPAHETPASEMDVPQDTGHHDSSPGIDLMIDLDEVEESFEEKPAAKSEPPPARKERTAEEARPPRMPPPLPKSAPSTAADDGDTAADAHGDLPTAHDEPAAKEQEKDKDKKPGAADEEIDAPPADNSAAIHNAKKRSWIVAACVHLGILLLLAIIHTVPMRIIQPEIVAITQSDDLNQPDWKKVTTSMPQASAMATVTPITSTGVSDISLPQIEATVTANELNIGSSLGSFGGAGMGGSVSFMGNKGRGKHIIFVVDVSGSMSSVGRPKDGPPISRFALLKKELTKSLSTMPLGTSYQVLFFSDFAWPHNEVDSRDLNKFDKYKWDIKPNDINTRIPRFSYLVASATTLNRSRKIIEDSDNPGGTNWGSGLLMALSGTPKPDVVFFMTDGNKSDATGWVETVTRFNQRGKPAVINTTAMMEPDAADELNQLAVRNGGNFTVVLPDGTVVKSKDYFGQ